MRYTGRLYSLGIVSAFNVLRYFYYHQYIGLPFQMDFFVLTAFFLTIAWFGGKQFDRATYYSEMDPLTNTYNRRTVERYFQSLTQKAASKGQRIGVVMIDLNDFKIINDTIGHHKGDQLLKEFAAFLKYQTKDGGMVARFGGDEFVLLLPRIPENFETTYVKNLQRKLDQASFTDSYSITASVGAATFPDQGKTFENLIKAADARMYLDKEYAKQ